MTASAAAVGGVAVIAVDSGVRRWWLRGGFPGGFGGGSSSADFERMREQMQEAQRLLTDAPTSMVMTYADPKLVMTSADGRIRTLFTDKRKQKTSNGNADVQTHWDNNRIVAETKFGSIKVIETYAVDGQQLIVTTRMDAPDGGRGRDRPNPELRRVYDRVQREERLVEEFIDRAGPAAGGPLTRPACPPLVICLFFTRKKAATGTPRPSFELR